MATVRMVVVQLEGADESVLVAIRSALALAGHAQDIEVQAAGPVEIAAPRTGPEPEKLRLVRGPVVKRAKAVKKIVGVPEAVAEPVKEATCQGQVFQLLKTGPKLTAELIKALPSYSPASVYLALKNLRGALVVKTDEVGGEQRNTLLK